MEGKRKPLIIVVSAPSGSGKTTIVKDLLSKVPGIARSISYTTRPPREDEKENEDYIFIPEEEFREKAEKGEFLEWEKNFDNYYGTARAQIEKAIESGTDIILSIDVKGARNVKKFFPESISVFIMPPSPEELASRLKSRQTDQESQVAMRLEESDVEIEAADEYDYLIVNDKLGKAVEELRTIIEEARTRENEKNKQDEEK